MDRLEAMTLLVAAVDEGSLAAAARRFGRSPATLSRAVALLEALAGETLLLRSTRKLQLTAAGEQRVAVWRDVLARLGEIDSAAVSGPPRGNIVLTAPELFGRLKVLPVLERYLEDHRHVVARVLLLNRVVDLTGEGVDLAVRLAPLPDSSLMAVKVGEVRTLLCAAPDYIARAGAPAAPADLADHTCIGLNADGGAELWPFAMPGDGGSRVRSVRVQTRLSINNAGAAIDAAMRGRGVVRVRAYQVAGDIAAGRLLRLLPAFEPPPTPVHLVFHAGRVANGPLRSFVDNAVPALRRELLDIAAAVPPPGAA